MPIKEVEPFDWEKKLLERLARRHNLWCFVDQFGYLVEQGGYDSEDRRASDAECLMWERLVPEAIPITQALRACQTPATPDAIPWELEDNLVGPGPYTLNAADVASLRCLKTFEPNLDRQALQKGLIGYIVQEHGRYTTPIYVSRAIPKGYFYPKAIERWIPPTDERAVEPDLDPLLEADILLSLHPLTCILGSDR